MHFAPHKLVMRQIGRRPTAAYLDEPTAVTGNVFTVMADSADAELFLLGVINSHLARFFWNVMFNDFKSSFPQFTIFSLSRMPICIPSDEDGGERREQLVAAVREMIQQQRTLRTVRLPQERRTVERSIGACDTVIDELVNKLYGLTDDEIALVESILGKE
jgi:hypothetical protein